MRVVVGISGGIAAYKAAAAIRSFVLDGHEVHVVPTPNALRFIGKPTLEALSRNPVSDEVFDNVAEVRHVKLGQEADLIVILPASANTIAKLAAGLADNLLGTTALATKAPLVIAPAMHTEMWEHPATVANIATLRARGATIVGPVAGKLTGQDVGVGRMAEPEDVVAAALATVSGGERDLAGQRIVVSAGGTREPIDPVRFIGNRSSGRHGVAIAAAAAARGASVTLVGANLQVASPRDVELVEVETTAELREAMLARVDADVVIMAAAVSDYRPSTFAENKLKKDALGERPSVELVQNPDILAELSAAPGRGLVVGFAAETERDPAALLELGTAKLARKGADLLVVNQVGTGIGFGDVQTAVVIIERGGTVVDRAAGDKLSVAGAILDAIRSLKERA